ncbi:MAG TPA: MarP family serine protease [Candidatus Saccharimonadales bacterium]|nr:MarP family serine protease [Candidatus Saccharimonadales bacterium]
MNLVDVIIIIFLISALFRGKEVGLARQLFSTVGFFGGLLVGAALQPEVVRLVHGPLSRSIIAFASTLGLALAFLAIGEYFGETLKHKFRTSYLNKFDNFLGSILAGLTLLIATWLSASILTTLPFPSLQSAVRDSKIIATLITRLPPAPNVIADLGHLIDPNGFPQVFSGNEPSPPANVNLPSSSELQAAVNKAKGSVVKIQGQGCGGIVEGSGFVAGNNLVATNAHVVAGIARPFVQDANGTHSAVAVWFDPNLDFAILRVANLAGPALVVNAGQVGSGTPAAILGFPGGGSLKAEAAAVVDEFTAIGRNIYNQGLTQREVYELAADIAPGNSGGPVVTKDGSVIGIVFAQSTTYNHIGYALTTAQIAGEIRQATAQNHVVNTGSCAE